MAGQYNLAVEVLEQCCHDFEHCGDPFLTLTSRIWLALALYRQGGERWKDTLAAALRETERLGAWFLWERPTFFGLRDVAMAGPMLQAFHGQGGGSAVRLAVRIMEHTGVLDVDHHPGYTLRVQTLGGFSVWRGFSEISHKEWQRDKARKLFQLLLTHRGTFLHREEICERLWPDADAETAERDFKVALHTLTNVLEPGRSGRSHSAFIVRRGALYGLWKGEYLPDVRYEPWCDGERNRLRMTFVDACVTYARLCCAQQRFAEAIAACERATAVEPTWEEAYVCWMQAAAGLYNRPLVIQVYRTCERVLRQELGVAPMASTRTLYETLVGRLA
ncbi:MAG: hypothetical protein IRZ10_11455 [Thermoflavifilum sp.]|nr:hypothetical protein [Thermoflavifilum sp.]MCL6515018.1 hypothetical protein [Alicyclobacillus sp.]